MGATLSICLPALLGGGCTSPEDATSGTAVAGAAPGCSEMSTSVVMVDALLIIRILLVKAARGLAER